MKNEYFLRVLTHYNNQVFYDTRLIAERIITHDGVIEFMNSDSSSDVQTWYTVAIYPVNCTIIQRIEIIS